MSRPWMPLYVADYLADTGHLSTLEHGAYMLLIMHYWQRGGLPDDDARLASIARASLEQWSGMRDTIAEFFNGDWSHDRIDEELEKARKAYEKRASAGRKGGKAKAKPEQSKSIASSNAEAMLNQPQPQPHIGGGNARETDDDLEGKLFDAGGKALDQRSHDLRFLGEPLRWLDDGIDLDRIVLPVIRVEAAKAIDRGDSIRTWKYFTSAVMRAHRDGQAPLPRPPNKPAQSQSTSSAAIRYLRQLDAEDEPDDFEGTTLDLSAGSGTA